MHDWKTKGDDVAISNLQTPSTRQEKTDNGITMDAYINLSGRFMPYIYLHGHFHMNSLTFLECPLCNR